MKFKTQCTTKNVDERGVHDAKIPMQSLKENTCKDSNT